MKKNQASAAPIALKYTYKFKRISLDFCSIYWIYRNKNTFTKTNLSYYDFNNAFNSIIHHPPFWQSHNKSATYAPCTKSIVQPSLNIYMYISKYIYLYYIATRRLRVCTMCVCLRPIFSRTAGPIWLNFFLLAPSWSRNGFRPKKFQIRDPLFPEIRKNPDFENFENIGTFRYSYKIDHNSKTDGLSAIFFASMVA